MHKRKIAITMGDPAGVGPEVSIRALSRDWVSKRCIPILIGDAAPAEDAVRMAGADLSLNRIRSIEEAVDAPGCVNLLEQGLIGRDDWQYGQVSARCGEAAFQYVVKGIELAMGRQLDAVVTGPINKEALHLAGHEFSGHTEIFAHYTHTQDYGMLLISNALRVIHVTTHVSMRRACDIVRENPERIAQTIRLADEAMRQLGFDAPRIAVAGLNAHASENGLFGDEEEVSILPAVTACQREGMNVTGPLPPDTVFVRAMGGEYDIVVAMYHDQGHIPLKLSGFRLDAEKNRYTSMSGINVTVGLPIIRTSVDHGTAFDRAGRGCANEESMLEAIEAAIAMAERRFPG